MNAKPIFSDCAFPNACQCAERGYEHEMDSCAVPRVREAAESLGLPAEALFGLSVEPPPVAIGDGVYQPVRNTGKLALDVLESIRAMQAEPPYSEAEIARILQYEAAVRGLRAEAGMMSSPAVIFHTRVEKLATGVEVLSFLTLSPSIGAGDCLYWNVICRNSDGAPFAVARKSAWTALMDMLRTAGGGTAGEARDTWATPPTEAEISDIEMM